MRVPPQWRSRYLEAVIDKLLPYSQITDDDVLEATSYILACMLKAPAP